MGRVQYAIALMGSLDDLLIRVVDTEPEARKFIADNPPRGVDGADAIREGPIAEAFNVRGCGPSGEHVSGYLITELVDGVPVRATLASMVGDDPFDPTIPLFAIHESVT